MRTLLLTACLLLLISCANEQYQSVQGNWIKGTEQEKLDIIEEQFAGFSTSMVEVNYRYHELYWAGQDENWEYADYLLEHLEEAIENGFVRRPERVRSAEQFMTNTIPNMEKAIASRDTLVFNKSFEQLRIDCRSCHDIEKVPFIDVLNPKLQIAPIRLSE